MPRTQRVKGCLVVIGVIFLGASLFIAREVYLALTATPGSAIDYNREFVRLAEDAQPPGRDGWPDLVEATATMDQVQKELGWDLVGEALQSLRDPTEIDWETAEYSAAEYRDTAREVLNRLDQAGVWDALDRLAASPRAVRDTTDQDVSRLLDVMLPESGAVRRLGRAVVARMRLAHERGDDAEVAQAFEHALALARAISSQPLLIDRLVGIAVSATAMNELQHQLLERVHDETALRPMLRAIEGQAMPDIAHAYEGERIVMMDTIQWTHTDDGNGDGRLILTQLAAFGSDPEPHPINNITSIIFPSKKETTDLANRFYDEIIDRARMTYQQRERTPGELTSRRDFSPRQKILPIMLPAFGRGSQSHDQWSIIAGGAKLALAIELFRVDTGAYPTTLTDLVPEKLDQLPIDTYARDSAFRYRPLNAPDADGRRYLLYSTSIDGIDNGGNYDPEELMIPRAQEYGFDVILNMPREDSPPTP
jgi:hypothetical protein